MVPLVKTPKMASALPTEVVGLGKQEALASSPGPIDALSNLHLGTGQAVILNNSVLFFLLRKIPFSIIHGCGIH